MWARPTGWRAAALLLSLAGALAGAVLLPGDAAAHARLVGADPAPGSALSTAPPALRLRFSEPVDARYSTATLVTATGAPVPVGALTVDPKDDRVAVVPIPNATKLAPGTYVLIWRVLSAADGHVTKGNLAFSAGTGRAPTGVGSIGAGERPAWWRVAARWLELGALTVVAGGFAFGGLIAAPLGGVPTGWAVVRRSLHRVWWPAFGLLVVGMALAFADQGFQTTSRGLGAPPPPHVYRDILTSTTYGTAWLVRLALLVPLAWLASSFAGRPPLVWRSGPSADPSSAPERPAWRWRLGLVLAGGALLTLPVAGHAAAARHPALAVAGDWVHLATAAVWLGGLAFLTPTLIGLARLPVGEDRAGPELGDCLLRRFSRVALVAVALLLASGVLNGYLHVAGPRNLRDQAYGVTLIVKHLLILPLLVAAAVNLLIIRPRLASAVRAGDAAVAGRALRAASVAVRAELVVGACVVLAAALLTELPPADAPLTVNVAARPLVIDQRATAGDLKVWLLGRLTGATDDRFTLSITGSGTTAAGNPPGNPPGNPTATVLRVIVNATVVEAGPGAAGVDAGQDRFDANRAPGAGIYEFLASRLGLAARWNVRVIVRRAGVEDISVPFAVDTRDAPVSRSRTVADAWRLPRLPVAAWVLVGLAVAVLVGGVVAVRRLPGLEPLGGGLILGMLVLVAASLGVRAEQQLVPVTSDSRRPNPVPADPGSVARGADLYRVQCALCHGPTGTGPPTSAGSGSGHQHGVSSGAALTRSSARRQRDGDLYHWISAGVGDTTMPAYAPTLTDAERWDLVNYLRSLQRQTP